MYLIIDAGNTSIKFGYYSNDKLIKLLISDKNKINSVKFPKFKEDITHIYIGTVVPSLNKTIINKLAKTYKVKPIVIENTMFKKHFNLAKFDLKEVGSDILSFALYLKLTYKKAIGICFGTATFTVCVNDKNVLGVTIVPSVYSLLESLNTSTELTKANSIKESMFNYFNFGTDTPTALASGANHMTKGFIDEVISYANKKYGITKCAITGGKSNLMKFLKTKEYTKKIAVVNELILQGYYLLVKSL